MAAVLTQAPIVSFTTARVADAMTSGVISCPPETPLRTVAEIMARRRVHAVYVFDYGFEDDETVELWGLVSDLDLVAAARGVLDRRTAREASVKPLLTVRMDDRLDCAAQLMIENNASHLAVIDPLTRRPVGVLSTLDVVRVVADEEASSSEARDSGARGRGVDHRDNRARPV
jgi:CBS domain-containing protein